DPFRPQAAPTAQVASSSNTDQGLNFEQAFQLSQSGDAKAFRQQADRVTQQMGLQARSYSAIGDWEDGAEHSVLSEIPHEVDEPTLRYVPAWHGLLGNQRAVLTFLPRNGGPDSVYEIHVPDTDAAKVRARLSQAGVPFRTIVPGKEG